MELQFVFGNPRKGKRKKSKKNKGGSKVAKRRKKKKKVVSKKAKKKTHKKARKAKKVRRTKRKSSRKKKNPMTKTIVVKDKVTKKVVAKDPARYHYGRKSGVTVSTPKELAYGRFQVAAAKEAARKTKNRKKKKKIKTLSKRLTKALKVAQEKRMSLLKDAKEKRASVRAPHHIVSTKTKYISQKRRKPVKKRKKVKSKRNPIFGAPRMSMNKIEQQFSKATGHDLKEAGLLFGAGATLPVIEGLLDKGLSMLPVLKDIKPALGKFGPEVAGMSSSLVTILVAGAAHYAVDKTGKGKQLEPVLRALIAASVVKAGSSLSGTVAKAIGMSGVIFHPGMSGINFTPMSGINFTPMSGAPQLGHAAPQMGYGADFGRGYDVPDYGGGDGYTESHRQSTADFGSYDGDEEPVLDQSSSMG